MASRTLLIGFTCLHLLRAERPSPPEISEGWKARAKSDELKSTVVGVRPTGCFQSLSHKKSSVDVQQHQTKGESSLLQVHDPDPMAAAAAADPTPTASSGREAYVMDSQKLGTWVPDKKEPEGGAFTHKAPDHDMKVLEDKWKPLGAVLPPSVKDSGKYDLLKEELIKKEHILLGKDDKVTNEHMFSVNRYQEKGTDSFKKNQAYHEALGQYVDSLFRMSAGSEKMVQKDFEQHTENVEALDEKIKEGDLKEKLDDKQDQGYVEKNPKPKDSGGGSGDPTSGGSGGVVRSGANSEGANANSEAPKLDPTNQVQSMG